MARLMNGSSARNEFDFSEIFIRVAGLEVDVSGASSHSNHAHHGTEELFSFI